METEEEEVITSDPFKPDADTILAGQTRRPDVVEPEPDPTVEPGWMESAAAGVRLQNPMSGLHLQTFPDKPDYNGVSDPLNAGYPPNEFVRSGSPEESAYWRTQIDEERDARDTIQQAGGFKGTVGEIFGAATNPLYYLGGAATSLPKFIASELIIEGVSEGALQYQQGERTAMETAVNILAAGAGAGIFGSLAKYIDPADLARANARLAEIMKNPPDADVPDFTPPQGGSVGAMMPETTLKQESMVGGRLAEAATVGPMGRLLQSRSVKARRLAQQIADNPYFMAKHAEGEGIPSLESLMGEYDGINASVLQNLDQMHKAHRKAGGKLTYNEFDEAVGHSLYNNDYHQDPHVGQAAAFQRKAYDEITERAQDIGLLPQEMEPFYAASYRPRLYSHDKLSEHLPWLQTQVFKSVMEGIHQKSMVVVRWPDGSVGGVPRSSYEKIKHNDGVYLVETSRVDHAERSRIAKQVATEMVDHIYNRTKMDPQIEGIMREAGMLKERTMPMFDNKLSKVLENRSSVIFGRYSKDMGFEISSMEEFGSKTLADEIESVGHEYSKLISMAKSSKERASLQKESAGRQQDLFDMRDIVAGQFGKPVRALPVHQAAAALRLLNAVSMLGGMTVSSIPDLARPMFRYGLKAYAKGLYRMATGTAKLSKADRLRMGIAIDKLTNGRMSAIADIGNHDVSWVKNTGDTFANLTLMTRWNDALKSLTSEIGADSMGKWIVEGTNKKILGRAGLSDRIQETIRNEIKRTGTVNPMKWADGEARQHFMAALRSEVNSIIVTPGAGDLPILARDPVGRMLLQFKSFLFAAHAKVLIQGMAQADANAAVGAIFMLGLGGLTTAIKDGVRGKDLGEKEPIDWVLDSMDRTGMMGLVMLPINSARQLAGNKPSRLVSQGAISNLTGPSLQTATDLSQSAFQFMAGDDINLDYLRRHVPMQNLLHWRDLLAAMGEDVVLTEAEIRRRN